MALEDRSKYEKFVDHDFEGNPRSSSSSSNSVSGESDIVERVAINDSLLGNPETDQLLIPPCPGSVTGSSGGSRPDEDRDSIGSASDIMESDAGHDSDSDHEDEEMMIAVVDGAQNDQLFVGHLEGSKHLLSDTDCYSDSDGESRRVAAATESKVTTQMESITLNSSGTEQDLDAEVERNLLCQVIRDKDQGVRGVKQEDLFGSKPFTETSANVAKNISSVPSSSSSLPSSSSSLPPQSSVPVSNGQDLFGAAPFSLLDTPSQVTRPAPITLPVTPKTVMPVVRSRSRDLVPPPQVVPIDAATDPVRRKSSAETSSVSSLKGIQKKKQETGKKKLKQDPKKKEITQSDEEEIDGLLNNDDDDEDGTMIATSSSSLKSKDKKKSKGKEEKKEEKVKKEKKEEKKDKKEDKKKDEKKEKKKDRKEEKKSSKRDKSKDPVVKGCSGFANLSFEDQTETEERTSSLAVNLKSITNRISS